MKDTSIEDTFVRTTELKGKDAPSSNTFGCVRVFRNAPGAVNLQIRTEGGIGECCSGKPRKFISTAGLRLEELKKLRALLDEGIDELEQEVP